MLKNRLIPCLLLRNGLIVQSKQFKRWQVLGNPTTAVRRLSVWASDELIYLDISPSPVYDLKRDDLNHPNRGSLVEIIKDVAKYCFMPLTFGGGIRTLEDIRIRLGAGADKVSVNTQAVLTPSFVTQSAETFGSQCVVVSIDAAVNARGCHEVKIQRGKEWTGLDPVEWAVEAEKRGAGEILLNSVDRDGTMKGFDLSLIRSVVEAVSIPVIAIGGAGTWEDLAAALSEGCASAVSAANIFHYTEQSVLNAKKQLFSRGFNVRDPKLLEDKFRDKSSVHDPTLAWTDKRKSLG
jgi:imidazole glycerol-phosphate synthase subunit HisF